jgi:2-polyprenyl-3-methyl-5-hydroxy-6-metoxy-1,4-benzoquinol methylase
MQRWLHYSKDPNALEVMERRRAAVTKARTSQLVSDRVEYLCQLVAGKSVLDIGVVEHTREATENPSWLHGNLRRHATRCLGVDVLAEEVEYLRTRGYNVLCADITEAPLAEKFDVIIAGEVLEHLDAPGMFMKNCAAMLDFSGRLAITVPNPWYANVMLKNLTGSSFIDSADHVAWYDASTLYELGQRYGLQLDRYAGIGSTHSRTFRARLFFGLQPILKSLGFSAELFAKSIIFEFVRI